jgi:hypothetical protein
MAKPETMRYLANAVGSSDYHCNLIRNAILPLELTKCSTELNLLLQESNYKPRQEVLSDLMSWCKLNRSSIGLKHAIDERDTKVQLRLNLHKRLVGSLWLKPNPIRREKFIASLPVIEAKVLPTSYPPLGSWVCETQQIYDLWSYHIKHAPQADKRLKRKPMMIVQPHRLTYDILPNQGGLIKVGERIVGMVVRDFCEEPAVKSWAEGVVAEGVEKKKSVRVRSDLSTFPLSIH